MTATSQPQATAGRAALFVSIGLAVVAGAIGALLGFRPAPHAPAPAPTPSVKASAIAPKEASARPAASSRPRPPSAPSRAVHP
jgi:hypothetical protein